MNSCDEYKRADFDTFLDESDIISIHAPLNDATRRLFSDYAFDRMKNNAYLINMGRGPIVDEKALITALNEEKIAGAALDVLEMEPMRRDSVLLEYKDSNRLLITPHIAWATVEARARLMHDVCLNIESFMKGIDRNVINRG